ncbi:MAG TPA: hypothetical protein VJZ76_20505 [Thermoanaerobaculia bacterium]|nr:hypothetical protein [Thermoanaerobaculia bacterium]
MWRALLVPLLIAVSACGGRDDIEERYKKAVAEQRAKSGGAPDQLVSIGMSMGQSGKDVAIVYYSGGERHDLVGIASTMAGDRSYQVDGGSVFMRSRDRDYGFRLVTPNLDKVQWKVRLYPDKIKIANNDDDRDPLRIRTESPSRATLAGPTEEPLGEIDFDGKNTVAKDTAGTVRYSRQTGKLEPSYGVFLIDKMPLQEKYITIAELMARNR